MQWEFIRIILLDNIFIPEQFNAIGPPSLFKGDGEGGGGRGRGKKIVEHFPEASPEEFSSADFRLRFRPVTPRPSPPSPPLSPSHPLPRSSLENAEFSAEDFGEFRPDENSSGRNLRTKTPQAEVSGKQLGGAAHFVHSPASVWLSDIACQHRANFRAKMGAASAVWPTFFSALFWKLALTAPAHRTCWASDKFSHSSVNQGCKSWFFRFLVLFGFKKKTKKTKRAKIFFFLVF